MIVIVNANNDKIELTPEEFKKYLEEARQEGYEEGYRAGSANVIRYPIYVHDDLYKRNWWDYGITWTANTEGTISAENITTGPITAKD